MIRSLIFNNIENAYSLSLDKNANNFLFELCNGSSSNTLGISLLSLIVAIGTLFFYIRTFLYDTKAERNSVKLIENLLKNSPSSSFPFCILRHHIGGYQDDEIRKFLVRAGAIRIKDESGQEYWILYKRMNKSHINNPANFILSDTMEYPATDSLYSS